MRNNSKNLYSYFGPTGPAGPQGCYLSLTAGYISNVVTVNLAAGDMLEIVLAEKATLINRVLMDVKKVDDLRN